MSMSKPMWCWKGEAGQSPKRLINPFREVIVLCSGMAIAEFNVPEIENVQKLGDEDSDGEDWITKGFFPFCHRLQEKAGLKHSQEEPCWGKR